MADLLDTSSIESNPALVTPRWVPIAWAVAASLMLHAVGFGILHNSLGLSTDALVPATDNQMIEASLLPAKMMQPVSQATSLPQPATATAITKTTRNTSTKPPIPPEPTADSQAPPTPTPDPVITTAVAADAQAPTTDSIVNESTAVAMPQTQEPPPTLLPQMLPHTRLPDEIQATTAATYSLPKQVTVRYETNYQGIAANSELQWKKIGDVGAQRYEASLVTSALGMQLRYTSLGLIGIKGLAPLMVEEKRPFKSTIATSIEPSNNRVVISSQAGFLPYDPLGHDFVSLIIQLGIYAQSLPQWSLPGIAQDFTVYRPNGIKRWRLQSQGLDTLQVRGETRQVVYIRRIAADGQPDYEDQYHFWLDPKHYGFPVKMRQIDSKGKVTDIVMTDWKEQ